VRSDSSGPSYGCGACATVAAQVAYETKGNGPAGSLCETPASARVQRPRSWQNGLIGNGCLPDDCEPPEKIDQVIQLSFFFFLCFLKKGKSPRGASLVQNRQVGTFLRGFCFACHGNPSFLNGLFELPSFGDRKSVLYEAQGLH